MADLLLAFYGDDFTGSTDAMESLTLGGVPTVLFFQPPTAEYITQHFPHVRAVGLAGTSRAMSPSQMDEVLPSQFAALQALDAPVVHYKVCSTFDSSPTIGSIGHAADIGAQIFQPRSIPVVVGSPFLRRYVVFGNLFAHAGGTTYRLDRHPTMSLHPITPMNESDLRLHLGKQTARKIALVDVLTIESGHDSIQARLAQAQEAGAEIVVFDTINIEHMRAVGRALWELTADGDVFVVGSSGVGSALTAHWQAIGTIQPPAEMTPAGSVDQIVVMSGSASPITAGQIEWALAHGFRGLRLNSARLIDPTAQDSERESVVRAALELLTTGDSVVLYTAQGPDDPAIAETKTAMQRLTIDPSSVGSILGTQQGLILKVILEQTGLRRVCVAGGDTSGYTALQMGIHALEMCAPLVRGAPLCRAYSDDAQIDGIEVALKGGQFGGVDYFGAVQRGKP